MTPVRILHLEDVPDDSLLVERALRREGVSCDIERVSSRAEFSSALAEERFDLVLADYVLPDYDGGAALEQARSVRPDMPFILVSGSVGEDRAVDMLHKGATDYVLKHRLERLGPAVRRALQESKESAEKRRAEAALRESQRRLVQSENRYRTLFELNPMPMWAYDVESLAFLDVNAAAMAQYGYSREEFLGMTIRDIRPTEDVRALMEDLRALKDAIAEGTDQPEPWKKGAIWRHRRKDGTIFDVEVVATPLSIEDQQVRLVLARDVSVQRRLEEQLRQSQKMDAIGRLAGGIAHDFNNILFVISGYAEQINRLVKDAEPLRQKSLGILKATDRAAALTRQLLTFSRKEVQQARSLDLNNSVFEMEKMLRRIIGEDVVLTTAPGSGLWRVMADPGQVEQVILNLAVNSRDAMPRGGRLLIETHNVDVDEAYGRAHLGLAPGSYVLLSVSDTGCGMDPQTIEHVFEPFFTTKDREKGTGLGLSIVYGIVRQSGGGVAVYSHPGRGTTFKIYLPRSVGALPVEVVPQPAGPPPRGCETVLLVEDDDEVRLLARQALEDHGYTVLETSHASAAIEIVKGGTSLDLLVTDMILGEMTGRELAEKARALQPALKVLSMSGYTSRALADQGELRGETAFLQKPFTLHSLVRKVREVLDAEVRRPPG